jgi:hypothetical protein
VYFYDGVFGTPSRVCTCFRYAYGAWAVTTLHKIIQTVLTWQITRMSAGSGYRNMMNYDLSGAMRDACERTKAWRDLSTLPLPCGQPRKPLVCTHGRWGRARRTKRTWWNQQRRAQLAAVGCSKL